MLATLHFYRENQEWYVDLPGSPFSKGDLQMVLGADTLLEMLGARQPRVSVHFSTTPFEGSSVMALEYETMEGGHYWLPEWNGMETNLPVWLCAVTRYVFEDGFPVQIYFKKAE